MHKKIIVVSSGVLAIVVAVALFLMVQFLFPWMAQFTSFTDSTIGSAQRP